MTDVTPGCFRYPDNKNFINASLSVWGCKGLNGAATVCVDDIMTVEQRRVHRRDAEVQHSAKIYPALNSWFKTRICILGYQDGT